MNQPTREEFEELKKELKEEVRQLREQITEPIRIDRLEIDRGGTQELLKETNKKLDKIIQTQTDRSERFDTLERGIQKLGQELNAHSENWLNTLQKDFDETTQQIGGISADTLKIRESQADFRDKLVTMATKDDLSTLKSTQDQRFDKIETTMATKDDIAELKGLMMQLLQQKPKE
jgi:hypothetical protein